MADTFSLNQSSVAISKKFNTSTNYNQLSNIPKTLLIRTKQDGLILKNKAVKFNLSFWNSLRKTDFTSNRQISARIMEQIFEKHEEEIKELFKITSSQEFMNVFDVDNDGFLNEDEQVLVFSVLKEKMQNTANNLLKIQEYQEFKLLMKEVRDLEILIAEEQDELRKQIQNSELKLYDQIGEERLEDYYNTYFGEFKKLEEYKGQRKVELQLKQVEERNQLEEKLGKTVELMKIKPKKKLKEYQIQEKLVSLDERVEEALDFRKELKDLEAKEQERVEKLQMERAEKQRQNLQEKHNKEKKQLENRLQEAQFKLIIRMKKDFNTLLKKNHLHEHEIKRIQGLTAKIALKEGLNQGELIRTKNKSRQQNQIITESKKIIQNQGYEDENVNKIQHQGNYSTMQNNQSTFGNITNNQTLYLKNLIKNGDIVNFYIKKKWGADLPVNYKKDKHRNLKGLPDQQKIERILIAKKKNKYDILPSLTELYDDQLRLKNIEDSQKSEEQIKKELQYKKNYINEMLSL